MASDLRPHHAHSQTAAPIYTGSDMKCVTSKPSEFRTPALSTEEVIIPLQDQKNAVDPQEVHLAVSGEAFLTEILSVPDGVKRVALFEYF